MAWAADFSYRYFRALLDAARRDFACHPICDAPQVLVDTRRPVLFLRHDVDVDLERAAAMAEIEAEMGVPATYMVLPAAPLYRLQDGPSREFLRRIIGCGCEIGLHFDTPESLRSAQADVDAVADAIDGACEPIEDVLGAAVHSLSFHRPMPSLLRGPLLVGGRVNAYARELMECYWSDSKGNWREGEPLPRLRAKLRAELCASGRPVVQLLTHPIWWGPDHLAAEDRLEEYFQARTAGASQAASQAVSDSLAETLPGVARRGRARAAL